MTDRQRIRRGRTVSYNPTAAEVTAGGAGPWLGMITTVRSDGSVDLVLDVPTATPVTGAALADPLIASADPDATYSANEQTLLQELKDDVIILAQLVNELRAITVNTRKTSVIRGAAVGQFSLLQTGPQAL
jgi:hypothetical protein